MNNVHNEVLFTHVTIESFNFKGRMNYEMQKVVVYSSIAVAHV